MPNAIDPPVEINQKLLSRKGARTGRAMVFHNAQFRGIAIRQAHRGAIKTDRLIKSADHDQLPGLARALDLFIRLEADLLNQPMGSRERRAGQPGCVIELGPITQDGPEAELPSP